MSENVCQFPGIGHKKRIHINGSAVVYRELGSGDPILFVHRQLEISEIWQGIFLALSKHHRCVAVDLPGFGDSDPLPPSDHQSFIEQQTEHFAEFIRALKIDKNILLIAHGVGTMVALDWAFQHQERLKGIVHGAGCFVDSSRLAGVQFEYLRYSPSFTNCFSGSDELLDTVINLLKDRCLDDQSFEAIRARLPAQIPFNKTPLDYLMHLPSEGMPWESHNTVLRYSTWLKFSKVPKLRVTSKNVLSEKFLARYHLVSDGFANQTDLTIDEERLDRQPGIEAFLHKLEPLIEQSLVTEPDPA